MSAARYPQIPSQTAHDGLAFVIHFLGKYMFDKTTSLNRLMGLVFVAGLTACGGGGGDTPASTAPAPVSVPPPASPAIVSSVPTPTYAAGSEELAAFTLLNTERERCGFGLLAQNAKLDIASKSHSEWVLINRVPGHFETAGTPGFTGVSPLDRAIAVGYGISQYSVVTSETAVTFKTKVGAGLLGSRELLNAPYHLMGMLRGYRDVGVAIRDTSDVGGSVNPFAELNFDFGYQHLAGAQTAAPGSLRTYPCAGTTNVIRSLVNESPNPAPGRDLSVSPLGSSVGMAIDVGHILAITGASMMNVATGATVVLRAPITGSNDPNATATTYYIEKNEGFISADAPLTANTSYQVTINATDNGVVLATRTFTFTTGL
jgi:hypothetical protein